MDNSVEFQVSNSRMLAISYRGCPTTRCHHKKEGSHTPTFAGLEWGDSGHSILAYLEKGEVERLRNSLNVMLHEWVE